MSADALRAPFPWFGGKSLAAPLVWRALGPVRTYVEPFAGSLATLLRRPVECWADGDEGPGIETVNDLDCYLANFWRAIQADFIEVAIHADWPVNEADLHARHRWLVGQVDFRERMRRDPEYFDARIAGWWAWGLSQWIGGAWCVVRDGQPARRPQVSGWSNGHGVHQDVPEQLPCVSATHRDGGVLRAIPGQIPLVRGLGHGNGVRVQDVPEKLPAVDGRGNKSRLQRPAVDGFGGKGIAGPRALALGGWFEALRDRLRRVRVCCGDWSRVLTPSVIRSSSFTGILLDPPYSTKVRRGGVYGQDDGSVSARVAAWAREHGGDPRLRIVLCGYEGEHDMPGWTCVAWKGPAGMSNRRSGDAEEGGSRHRERLWLSPACLPLDDVQLSLLAAGGCA